MTNLNENAHVKTIANFHQLLNYVTTYGSTYNPSKETIKVSALTTLLTNAQKTITDYNKKLSQYKTATVEREVAFEPLNKLTTRILNVLKTTNTSSKMNEIAKSLVRKVKGERASAKIVTASVQIVETAESEAKQITSAQTSYDNRLDNFDKLIVHLQNIPQYKPGEVNLQTETLMGNYTNMHARNNRAKLAAVALTNARATRDKILYHPLTGLTDVASDTKAYIKSLFGATSPEFNQVNAIEFKSVN